MNFHHFLIDLTYLNLVFLGFARLQDIGEVFAVELEAVVSIDLFLNSVGWHLTQT